MTAPTIRRTARLSEDGVYRYLLTRAWADGPMDVWVMLNPSTADAEVDDNTIRRCIGFSRGWGAGCLAVVNLFALRSTDPAALNRHPDPIGDENDNAITAAIESAADTGGRVIAAWGAHRMAVIRGAVVADMVRSIAHAPIQCMGTTAAGAPKHPLYLAADTAPTPWQRGR